MTQQIRTAPHGPTVDEVRDFIMRGLTKARELADAKGGDHYQRSQAFHALAVRLGQRLTEKFAAMVDTRGDLTRVSVAGITSTSTQAINGALRNWLVAARKKEEQQ